MMDDKKVREVLKQKIIFGVNRTGILYNKQRMSDPEKYDLPYQNDYYLFQARRATDPGFYRHIFMLSHKSHNFQSNREFVMKAVLRDLCAGRFNTDQLSGEVDLEAFHKKNKSGDYDPRHTRRRLNNELKELVVEKGRIDSDERKISYSSAFNLDQASGDPILGKAAEKWKEEVNQLLSDEQRAIKLSVPISLLEIYSERLSDLIELQKDMLEILGKFEQELRSSAYFSALHNEISTFSPVFIVLCNHINSICEIFWFMKKGRDKRSSLLLSSPFLKVDANDIEKTLSLMRSISWKNEQIVLRLLNIPRALISFHFDDLALKLLDELMVLGENETIGASVALGYLAIMRDIGKYKDMLELSLSVIKKYALTKDRFTYTLLRIRCAEALALTAL